MSSSIARVVAQVGGIILGKTTQVRLALACLLARGHLLIEDVPGVGKTTLAHALAASLGLAFHRIQFTSDLLPADILGVSIYDRDKARFHFHPGPVFSQIVLADEVNRATPKAQSALLEAMEEHQVTVEGETRRLPEPFFVIATQNPSYQVGTFPLPESQLDRFLMRLSLGFPEREGERALLAGEGLALEALADLLTPAGLLELRSHCRSLHCNAVLIDYVLDLMAASRGPERGGAPLSPRASQGLLAAARAWALLAGRDFVIPADVQAVFPAVAEHRLDPTGAGQLSAALLEQVDALR